MTSSIRIAQVFPELVGKMTRAIWKVYGGMLKYMINYAFYLAHYDAYFHMNNGAKRSVDSLVSQISLYSLLIYLV